MIRNLLYFICPIAESEYDWKNNIDVLKEYLKVFNGRKIILVAQGEGIADVLEVKQRFGEGDFEFLTVKNSVSLGETHAFKHSLGFLKSEDPNEATFYAHAKGVSPKYRNRHQMLDNIRTWRCCMYHFNLHSVKDVEAKLQQYAAYGCFKAEVSFTSLDNWHYAGTFFWFRHDRIFTLPNWDNLLMKRHGVEVFLGRLIEKETAYDAFPRKPFDNLYKSTKKHWQKLLQDTSLPLTKVAELLECRF